MLNQFEKKNIFNVVLELLKKLNNNVVLKTTLIFRRYYVIVKKKGPEINVYHTYTVVAAYYKHG